MGYAPHTNTHVRDQLRAGLVPTPLPIIFGAFRHKETGILFEYAERRWHDDTIEPAFPHVIYVNDPVGFGSRLAKVHETVAYVLVDEDVIEKWPIKQHRRYDTRWVRS